MKKINTQRLLYTVIMVLTIVIFFLINITTQLAEKHYSLSIDLTDNKLYELSEQTKYIINKLVYPTKITILSPEVEYPTIYREILAKYVAENANISLEYTALENNPLLASHYKQMGITLTPLSLLISGNERSEVVVYEDTLIYENDQLIGLDLEQQLTSAILYVNTTQKASVAFSTGHNERISETLKNAFASNFYSVENIALGIQPLSTDVLVIASPVYDFSKEEIDAVEMYLQEGGSVMVFVEPQLEKLTTFYAFLEKWGITPEQNIIYEKNAYLTGSPSTIIPKYTNHEINTYFATNPIFCVLPSTASLTLLSTAPNMAETNAILQTTEDAYSKTNLVGSTQLESTDKTGPFTVVAMSTLKINNEKQAKLWVSGSRMMVSDDVMQMSSYANNMFISQVISFLHEEKQNVSIPYKSMELSPLTINTTQAYWIGIIVAGIIPLCILLWGIWVFSRRRKR